MTVILGTFNTSLSDNAEYDKDLPEDYKGSFAEKLMGARSGGTAVTNGDKDKAMKAVYEVVTGEGIGTGHEGECFLPLGTDMATRVKTVHGYLQHAQEVFGPLTSSVKAGAE